MIPRIRICLPFYNFIENETSKAVEDLLRKRNFKFSLNCFSVSNVTNARNYALNMDRSFDVNQNLSDLADGFLFVDSDVVFRYEDFARLYHSEMDVVGGVYHPHVNNVEYVTGKWRDGIPGLSEVRTLKSELLKEHPEKGPVEVDWIGCGFLYVSTKALESTPYPWFHQAPMRLGNQAIVPSEDKVFCANLKRAGFRVHADLSTEVKHLPRQAYIPPSFKKVLKA